MDGARLVLVLVGTAFVSSLATVLLANFVVSKAVEGVVRDANAKQQQQGA